MKQIILICIFFTSLYSTDIKGSVGFTRNNTFDYLSVEGSIKYLQNFIFKIGKKKENTEILINYYENDKKIFDSFKNSKIDGAAANTYSFFKLNYDMDDIEKSTMWSMSFSKDDGVQYCILKQKDIGNSFRNKVVSIGAFPLINHWFNNKMLKKYKKPALKIVQKINKNKKDSTSILNVYFKKADFAVVTKDSWETMLELNPAIKRKITLKECSKNRFPLFIGFFRKGSNLKFQKASLSLVLNMHKGDKELESLFSLISFDHFYKIKYEYIKNTKNFFKDYERLKKKYK